MDEPRYRNWRVASFCRYGPREWWFRLGVYWYGVSREPLAGHRPLFSEREGWQRAWHTKRSCWKWLKPLSLVKRDAAD